MRFGRHRRLAYRPDRNLTPARVGVEPPAPAWPRRVPVGTVWESGSVASWLPSERLLSAFLALLLVLASASFGTYGAGAREHLSAATSGNALGTTVLSAPSGGTAGGTRIVQRAASPGSAAALSSQGTTTRARAADDEPFPRDASGNLFPQNRIVAYYGTSINSAMGILGMDTIDNTYAKLMDQVQAWEEADPNTHVIPAWEYIATVAQPTPQSDGTYLYDVDFDEIQKYIDFADDHGMLTFIDVQVGARGVHDEVTRLEPLLSQPNVMLAIDPEFAVHGDMTPGEDYGWITADDVNWAMTYLVKLSADRGIPQKVLMIHQFRYDMIHDKEDIQNTPGVELVLHADGHGIPDEKKEAYDVLITKWAGRIAFWPGVKIFYNRDDPDLNQYTDIPNMTPEEILQLDPVPYYISYQ